MADIVSSLFGLSPREQYARDRQQEFEMQARTVSGMYDNQFDRQNAYLGSKVGSLLAQGVGNLFGLQDPALKRMSGLEGVLQEAQQELGQDMADPTKLYPTLADKLQQRGFGREAAMVTMQGQEAINQWKLNQAKLDSETAQAGRFRAEAASKEQETKQDIDAQKALAAFVQQNGRQPTQDETIQIIGQYMPVSKYADFMAKIGNVKEKRSAYGQMLIESGLSPESPEYKKAMAEYTKAELTGKAKGSGTTVSVNMDKSAGSKVGDILEKALPGAEQAVGSLQTVNQLRKIVNSKDLIVGPGANLRTNLARISNVYLGGNNPEQLGNTRTAIQGLANLALNARSRLQGSGAISNYEQEVVQRATSAGIEELTVPEMKVLLDIVERDAKQTYSNYERKYKKVKDPDLQDFYAPPPIPQMDSGTTRPAGSPTLRWNPKTKTMEKV